MRVIIYGCNPLAAALVADFAQSGADITLLGEEAGALRQLTAAYPAVHPILASEPEMRNYLQQAGISHADIFLAMTPDDHDNILAAQTARSLFDVPKVVCHIASAELREFYSELGLTVVGYSTGLVHNVRRALQPAGVG